MGRWSKATEHVLEAGCRVRKLRRWLQAKAAVMEGQGRDFEAAFLAGLDGYLGMVHDDLAGALREVEDSLNCGRLATA